VLAALNFPALFSSMILVDPVIISHGSYSSGLIMLKMAALTRRERWPSQ
jgi:hypothetical protein